MLTCQLLDRGSWFRGIVMTPFELEKLEVVIRALSRLGDNDVSAAKLIQLIEKAGFVLVRKGTQ